MDLPDNMVADAREKLAAINVRSIKKVAEAKARKTRRLQRALTKVRKKANAVAAKTDISEREKSREIEKMYKKKLGRKEKNKKTLVVGRKFQAGSGGKKGRNVKMVDSRTRSDTRGEKSKVKRTKAGISKDRKGRKQRKGKQYGRR